MAGPQTHAVDPPFILKTSHLSPCCLWTRTSEGIEHQKVRGQWFSLLTTTQLNERKEAGGDGKCYLERS